MVCKFCWKIGFPRSVGPFSRKYEEAVPFHKISTVLYVAESMSFEKKDEWTGFPDYETLKPVWFAGNHISSFYNNQFSCQSSKR